MKPNILIQANRLAKGSGSYFEVTPRGEKAMVVKTLANQVQPRNKKIRNNIGIGIPKSHNRM
jgi:hypothetical protein